MYLPRPVWVRINRIAPTSICECGELDKTAARYIVAQKISWIVRPGLRD